MTRSEFNKRIKLQQALERADKPVVYECGCGSNHFQLMKTGLVKCVGCEEFYTDIEVHIPEGVPAAA